MSTSKTLYIHYELLKVKGLTRTLDRISVSIIVSFVARALGTLSNNLFCYSAVSSAGVVLILPGFTIRKCHQSASAVSVTSTQSLKLVIAALELTSRNILCGSVRMVYAIIYTLFLVSLLL